MCGSSDSRDINGVKLTLMGSVLSPEVRERFTIIGDSIRNSHEEFKNGNISSLLFFENPDILRLTEFENKLIESFFHLEEVCCCPTLDLNPSSPL